MSQMTARKLLSKRIRVGRLSKNRVFLYTDHENISLGEPRTVGHETAEVHRQRIIDALVEIVEDYTSRKVNASLNAVKEKVDSLGELFNL